jgi:hypothetical protein
MFSLFLDTRNLDENIDAESYVSISALILNKYASTHGYDFIKITPNVESLVQNVKTYFCGYSPVRQSNCLLDNSVGDKYQKTSYHPGLLEVRMAIICFSDARGFTQIVTCALLSLLIFLLFVPLPMSISGLSRPRR